MKDPVVFWSGGSTGHAMRNCIVHNTYGSSVYTAGIANDLDYCNNIVDSTVRVWVYQDPNSARRDAGGQAVQRLTGTTQDTHYTVLDSLFANNQQVAASGLGARMQFQDLDASFLKLVNTQVTSEAVHFEHDQTSRNYLHPVDGSDAAKIGAGLFMQLSN